MTVSTTDNDNPCAEIDPTAGIDYGNRARNQLMEEYPWLWEKSVEFDFAERLGGCTDPPLKEIDHAMFELWTARRNAMSIADSHRFGRMTMSKTDRDAAIRPPGSDCQESIAANRQESPRVETASDESLLALLDKQPSNRLLWSARAKDAWRELQRRTDYRLNERGHDG